MPTALKLVKTDIPIPDKSDKPDTHWTVMEVRANPNDVILQRAVYRAWNAYVYEPLRTIHFVLYCFVDL